MFAFGDNSSGQIEAGKDYAIRKAKRLNYLDKIDGAQVTEIHAGESFSAMTTHSYVKDDS